MEALPQAIQQEALLTAGIREEDIMMADEAVQAALVTGERGLQPARRPSERTPGSPRPGDEGPIVRGCDRESFSRVCYTRI